MTSGSTTRSPNTKYVIQETGQRHVWAKPVLNTIKIKDITRDDSGSGTDGGLAGHRRGD